jgi:Protein of unknown function (DUF4435)
MSNSGTTSADTLMERLRESASRGSVLLLEGDSDVSFFTGLLGDKCPEAVPAEGRLNALAAAALIPSEALLNASVLTIVDSDFDRITNGGALSQFRDAIHVVFTDAHDLEMTIISVEEVRRRVLTTVLRCTILESVSVWNRALAYQVELSLFRLLIHRENWGVNVGGIEPNDIDDEDGRPNRGKLVAELFPRFESRRIGVQPGELMVLLRELEGISADWPQLVNGHELCKSICVYARQLLSRNVNPGAIEMALYLSFQLRHLSATEMARQVRRWCKANGLPALF